MTRPDELGWPDGPIFYDVQPPERERISQLNPKWSVRWQDEPGGHKSLIVGCEVDFLHEHPGKTKGDRLDYWYRRFDPMGGTMASMRWAAWNVAERICHETATYGVIASSDSASINIALPESEPQP